MPTEIFSREQFESALPHNKSSVTEDVVWKTLGLQGGEFCYYIPVKSDVVIHIRSSVKSDGVCADTGQDSIRCTLTDPIEFKPLASKDTKPQRWVARTKNWRINLLSVLRDLYKLGLLLGTCPKCKVNQLRLRRVKKQGPNKDRLFVTCDCGKHFVWVDEEIKSK